MPIKRIASTLAAAGVSAALCCTTAVAAQPQSAQSPSREAFYRCKDARGQTYYGDSRPSQCATLDTEVLNNRGMLIRTIEGDATRAARESRQAEEDRARKEREARKQRDTMLIETYLTVEDIERLRDQRLELLESNSRITELSIRNLQERQVRLEAQIARFRPYSDKPEAPPLPDHLAEEMVNTVNTVRNYEEQLAKNRSEQASIRTSFDADIRRFKELKGIK